MRKLFLIIVLPFSLCSCAAVQFKQGFLLKNNLHSNDRHEGIVEIPRAYGRGDAIRLENPPITIRIGRTPKTSILSIGPGVLFPVPIIPWIPGIIGALKGKNSLQNNEQLQILITLRQDLNLKKIDRFEFDAQNARLVVGKEILKPISATCKSYIYQGYRNEANRAEAAGCGEGQDKRFLITTQTPSEWDETIVTLTFDILYTDFHDAVLELGEMMVDGRSFMVPSTAIKSRGKLKIWWAYTINT